MTVASGGWRSFAPAVKRLRSGCPGQVAPHHYSLCATVPHQMAANPQTPPKPGPGPLYCPNCAEEVTDPLTCGDCSAVICRKCGTPLESPDELGIG